MRHKLLTVALLYLSLILSGLFAFDVISTSASDVPGQFSGTGGIRPLTPATLISLGLFDSNNSEVQSRTNLVPQEHYEIRFNIQDTSVFDYRDLSRVTVKMFYSTAEEFSKTTVFGDTSYGSGVTLETTSGGDVFVWEWTLSDTNVVNSGIQFEEGLDASISSWSNNIHSGLKAPSQAFIDTSGTEQIDFDFVIPLQVSKIATLAENRN
jgi:hypothetical protein